MQNTKQIIANIRRQAAILIVEEIGTTGVSNCYNTAACIAKVKRELNIDLKENEQGYLIKA